MKQRRTSKVEVRWGAVIAMTEHYMKKHHQRVSEFKPFYHFLLINLQRIRFFRFFHSFFSLISFVFCFVCVFADLSVSSRNGASSPRNGSATSRNTRSNSSNNSATNGANNDSANGDADESDSPMEVNVTESESDMKVNITDSESEPNSNDNSRRNTRSNASRQNIDQPSDDDGLPPSDASDGDNGSVSTGAPTVRNPRRRNKTATKRTASELSGMTSEQRSAELSSFKRGRGG